MTFIGKIFIVAILVMSILFMGFAMAVYTTHQNWRELVQGPGGLQARYTTVSDEAAQLQTQLEKARNELAVERAARVEALSTAEQRAVQQKQALLAKEEQFQALQAEHREAIQAVTNYQENLRQLTEEVGSLRDNIRKAQDERDEQFQLVKTYTNQIFEQEGQLRALKQQTQQLLRENAQAKLVLDRIGRSADDPVDDLPPKVTGEVTKVSGTNLVEISLGLDEGLRVGHQLRIYRPTDGSFLATVEIIDANSDRAVARVLPETRSGTIRKGDRVASKI
jgi:regulator of replication initiation timing